MGLMPLDEHEAARLGQLAPYFKAVSDDFEYEFDNGRVRALVNMNIENRDIGILEWYAFEKRQGHTRQALQELRRFFSRIEVLGSYPENDPDNPEAWQCWSKMFEEGLVDFVFDHNSRTLERNGKRKLAPN